MNWFKESNTETLSITLEQIYRRKMNITKSLEIATNIKWLGSLDDSHQVCNEGYWVSGLSGKYVVDNMNDDDENVSTVEDLM